MRAGKRLVAGGTGVYLPHAGCPSLIEREAGVRRGRSTERADDGERVVDRVGNLNADDLDHVAEADPGGDLPELPGLGSGWFSYLNHDTLSIAAVRASIYLSLSTPSFL